MERQILHVDVNNAFLSWTAVYMLKNGYPVDIRTIPSIIGGDEEKRSGIVLAKSPIAKKFGIITGEPIYFAKQKCNKLEVFQGDFEVLKSPGFLQGRKLIDIAKEINSRVERELGFTVNVGISTNKLLAKMASDFQKPDKIHTLFPEEIQAKMWPLPIGELYMAGRSSVETLKKLEIYTIGDLAQADPALIALHMKSHGRMLWDFANGIHDSVVRTEQAEAKGIGNSTTVSEDLVTFEEVQTVFEGLSNSVGRRLRKAGQRAYMVSMEIKYYDFQTVSHQMQLTKPTDEDRVLYESACRLFEETWDGEPVRLLGIRTSKLVDASEPVQLSIFDIEMPS